MSISKLQRKLFILLLLTSTRAMSDNAIKHIEDTYIRLDYLKLILSELAPNCKTPKTGCIKRIARIDQIITNNQKHLIKGTNIKNKNEQKRVFKRTLDSLLNVKGQIDFLVLRNIHKKKAAQNIFCLQLHMSHLLEYLSKKNQRLAIID